MHKSLQRNDSLPQELRQTNSSLSSFLFEGQAHMSSKKILYHEEAREKLEAGANKLANAVRVTLGPRGRTVLLQRSFGAPVLTKDGVTVAKEIELPDPFENLGAQFVREVASKTNEVAGDGTTTATVLAQAMLREGLKLVASGADPMQIKSGIEAACEAVVLEIARRALPVSGHEAILQVATVAANQDREVGQLVAEAHALKGAEGVISLEDSQTGHSHLEHVEGMQLDRGYLSPYFFTDSATMEAVLENPYILLSDIRISKAEDLVPIFELVTQERRSFLVIAPEVQGDALALLVINKLNGVGPCVAVKAPGFGEQQAEILKDIAALTGAQVISESLGHRLTGIRLEDLGQASRVRVGPQHCTLVGGQGGPALLEARVKHLREAVARCDSDYEKEKLEQRLGRLTAGVTILRVGAPTETELKEKRFRVEDALAATRAAQAEGIVPGGGSTYVHLREVLLPLGLTGDAALGVQIVARALEQPLRSIADNAGATGAVVVEHVKELPWGMGFDALTLEYVDMIGAGIIDPAKVVRNALQNAASIAAMVLTTEILICEEP